MYEVIKGVLGQEHSSQIIRCMVWGIQALGTELHIFVKIKLFL
jgi:hypothetical protein